MDKRLGILFWLVFSLILAYSLIGAFSVFEHPNSVVDKVPLVAITSNALIRHTDGIAAPHFRTRNVIREQRNKLNCIYAVVIVSARPIKDRQ